MAAALQSALRGTMDLTALCVLGGKTVWQLYVDCLVLNDGGAVLAALSAAARAALAVTRLPKVRAALGPAAARGAPLEGPRPRLDATPCSPHPAAPRRMPAATA